MSAQPNDQGADLPAPALAPPAGQWRPVRPAGPRTPKQAKRELRKDLKRRRRILERARHDPTLTDFEVRVLGGLLFHSDSSARHVYPKVPTVAAGVHGHPRSVRRCVAQLEVAGYVKRFMRPVPGHKNLSNLYYFCEPPGPIPRHRPDQRRRPRTRRPDRGTAQTAGTPEGLIEPSPAGAVQPGPPPLSPSCGRQPLPKRLGPPQPAPWRPVEGPPAIDEDQRDAAIRFLAESRATLRALNPKPKRP